MSSKKRQVQKELERGNWKETAYRIGKRLTRMHICGSWDCYRVAVTKPKGTISITILNTDSSEFVIFVYDYDKCKLHIYKESDGICPNQLSAITYAVKDTLGLKNEGETSNYANNARG